ncbi:MAG: hypothetical protein LBD76_05330 [Prevotellaceae bacterium]|jgi:hypothetical protein|nr:hypothetical protein [Prevotellaceae bacterium]
MENSELRMKNYPRKFHHHKAGKIRTWQLFSLKNEANRNFFNFFRRENGRRKKIEPFASQKNMNWILLKPLYHENGLRKKISSVCIAKKHELDLVEAIVS